MLYFTSLVPHFPCCRLGVPTASVVFIQIPLVVHYFAVEASFLESRMLLYPCEQYFVTQDHRFPGQVWTWILVQGGDTRYGARCIVTLPEQRLRKPCQEELLMFCVRRTLATVKVVSCAVATFTLGATRFLLVQRASLDSSPAHNWNRGKSGVDTVSRKPSMIPWHGDGKLWL